MAIDLSGLSFFMPVVSFLFVFVVIYALLVKTKIIGDSNFVHLLISFIVAIVFISFSSMELFVRTVIPWFAVLIIVLFLVLLLGLFSSKDWVPQSWLGWVFVGLLGLVFLISAIKVFNPVFHPDLILTSGVGGYGNYLGGQVIDFFTSSKVAGSFLLIIVAVVVSWVLTKGE